MGLGKKIKESLWPSNLRDWIDHGRCWAEVSISSPRQWSQKEALARGVFQTWGSSEPSCSYWEDGRGTSGCTRPWPPTRATRDCQCRRAQVANSPACRGQIQQSRKAGKKIIVSNRSAGISEPGKIHLWEICTWRVVTCKRVRKFKGWLALSSNIPN